MSSQPNQSLIDGIRCLQYLVSSDRAIGCRELARLMDINTTRVNRLLMTMASIGLTMQDEHRRYLPGPGIHALAAQAIRGSALFSHALPILERHAPKDIVVALGVLWEDQIIYIYHSTPGSQVSQALAGFRMSPAWQSVPGMALLAAESDEALMQRFTPEQWRNLAPHVAQQRRMWRSSASGDTCCGITLMVKFLWRNRWANTPQRWPLRECGGLMRRRRLRVYRR